MGGLVCYAQVFECARCWHARQWLAVFELLKQHFDSLVELLVFASIFAGWVVVEQNVGVYTVVFHNPMSAHVVVGEEWHVDLCSVDVRQRTCDADDAAPRTCADYRTNLVFLKAPREQVAIAC